MVATTLTTLEYNAPRKHADTAAAMGTAACGGVTLTDGTGTWTGPDGTVEREPVTVVKVYGTRPVLHGLARAITALLADADEQAVAYAIGTDAYVLGVHGAMITLRDAMINDSRTGDGLTYDGYDAYHAAIDAWAPREGTPFPDERRETGREVWGSFLDDGTGMPGRAA